MRINIYERTYIAGQLLQTVRNTIGIPKIQNVIKYAIAGFGDVDVKINGVITLHNYTSDMDPAFLQRLSCCIANTCIVMVQTNIETILENVNMQIMPSTITKDDLRDIILSNDLISKLFMIVPESHSTEIIC